MVQMPPGSRHSLSNSRRRFSLRGFSLLELLTVIAMVAVLASLSISGLTNAGSAAKLRHGADLLATHGMWARQHAATRAVCTALVVRSSGGNDETAYRGVAIYELTSRPDGGATTSADWKRVSRWEQLPDGVLMDPDDFPGALLTSPQQNFNPALPDLSDSDGGDYRVVYFGPNGSLLSSDSPVLRVIEGTVNDGNVVRTGTRDANLPVNYIDLVFIAATGQTIVREQQ